jgi:hypothetical protein
MRKVLIALSLSFFAATASGATEPFPAERAFAKLVFGRHYEDPCAHSSQGDQTCQPVFSDRGITFSNDRVKQSFSFGPNRCIIRTETEVTKTGRRFKAVLNMQNVRFVNLNKWNQDGSVKEVELYLRGDRVLETSGETLGALIFIHKYHSPASEGISPLVKQELQDMREALKAYQDSYCDKLG